MRHRKQSTIPDGDNADLVLPSDWNDVHVVKDPSNNEFTLAIAWNPLGVPTIQLQSTAQGGPTYFLTSDPANIIVKGEGNIHYRLIVDAAGNVGTEQVT